MVGAIMYRWSGRSSAQMHLCRCVGYVCRHAKLSWLQMTVIKVKVVGFDLHKNLGWEPQGRGGVSGLDGRAPAQIVRGVGLSPTWHYTFPWIRCLGIILLFSLFNIHSILQSLLHSWTMYIMKWKIRCCNFMLTSLPHGWWPTIGSSTSSYSMKPGRSWVVRPYPLEQHFHLSSTNTAQTTG